jgi:hypothetical protein
MTSATPRTRWIALLPLALQLALPSVLALADARLEAASAAAPVHVESQAAAKTCAVLHPDNCALCRFLSSPQARAQSAAVTLPAGAVRSVAARDVLLVSRIADHLSPPARAPPVLA